jgi:hypothetical protein
MHDARSGFVMTFGVGVDWARLWPGEETYRSDPASGSGGADSARRLAKSVAEHIKGGI